MNIYRLRVNYVTTATPAYPKLNSAVKFYAAPFCVYPFAVTELDQFWANELAQALEKAKAAGRNDIADYLTLRASNDFLRSSAVKWLMRSFTDLAEEFRLTGKTISLETDTKHSFRVGHSTMAGSRLSFRYGVRALTIEAGWTRTPEHGFMRGNSLAHAKISHFGITKANKELVLVKTNDSPLWLVQEDEQIRTPLFEDFFHENFSFLLSD